MKRIYLWLRELSLTQQLMTIVLLVITLFTVFVFTILTPQIDHFTENEMYRMLHNSQDTLVYYLETYPEELPPASTYEDAIIQGIYDAKNDSLHLTKKVNVEEKFIAELKETIETMDGKSIDCEFDLLDFDGGNKSQTVYYVLTTLQDGRYLVSLMPTAFEVKFRTMLVNNIVNINVVIAAILFVLLTIWVATLIHPLNLIRNYIIKIKNEEECELNVSRRDEIGEVANALMDMQAQLEKQNADKQEMIQNISHDLKTPIATIKSYGESIKDGIYPYGSLEKSIDVIIQHADRLEKKVRSLIALNKMGYLLDDCEPGDTLDMNQVIDQVLLSLKVIRPEITFEKDCSKDVYFHGDEDPWRIVVENLVDNALRYAKTKVKISLHENELRVMNDGAKISEARLEKLFKPYEKGTNGQFGLGLSIVYKVATTYGYKVEADNLEDGVVFVVFKEVSKKKSKSDSSRITSGK